MNEWMADADRQYKKKRRTDMQETWLEQFYNEMDAEKRLDILNTNADKTVNASEMANHSAENPEEVDVAFIKKLWVARYGCEESQGAGAALVGHCGERGK